MNPSSPGEIELYGHYRQHLGPRCEAAGLRIQFHLNQEPGIHFKVPPPEQFEESILRGIRDGLDACFPGASSGTSVWVTEITDHGVDSTPRAFYRAGRMLVDQALSLSRSLQVADGRQ